MRLNKFLSSLPVVKAKENEEVFENIIKLLEKDCKPFLRDFKKSPNMFMYRGSQKTVKVDPGILEVKPRKNRKPKDMPSSIHYLLDVLFNKKFGWKPRSEGVFATPRKSDAESYGINMCLVFPIGKYKYLWSEQISDLYTYIRDNGMEYTREEMEYEWKYNYSSEAGGGTYYYFDKNLGVNYKQDAIEKVIKLGIEEDKTKIKKNLKWVPDIEKEKYVRQELERRDNKIKKLVYEEYIDNRLYDNIFNEVMFKCDKYYLVRDIYYELIFNHYFK